MAPLGQAVWGANASPAVATGRSEVGTHGGAAVAVPKRTPMLDVYQAPRAPGKNNESSQSRVPGGRRDNEQLFETADGIDDIHSSNVASKAVLARSARGSLDRRRAPTGTLDDDNKSNRMGVAAVRLTVELPMLRCPVVSPPTAAKPAAGRVPKEQ